LAYRFSPLGVYRRPSAAEKNKAEGRRMKAEGFLKTIRVYLRLSAFICGSILVFLGALGGLGGLIIVLGSLGVLAVQLSLISGG